ncbi:MAG: hypothetical protein AAFR73_12775, partial [Pseudomonadota bacterium]
MELTIDQQRAIALASARARLAGSASPTSQPEAPSFMATLRDNLLGDNDPTTQNFGEKVGTALNRAGEAMTFGLIGDEASAAVESVVPGVDYETRRDHYRQQQDLLGETNPGVAMGADVGGAILGAATPFGMGARAGSLGARAMQSSTLGAAGGATYGAMEGEGAQDRRDGAFTGGVLGGTLGAVIPVAGAGIQRAANNRLFNRIVNDTAQNAPTTQQLREQGQQLYQQVDDAGVQVSPESFNSLRARVLGNLNSKTGFDPLPGAGGNTPKAARVTQTMDEMAGQMSDQPTAQLPFSSLDQLRRRAGSPAMSQDPIEARAGSEIIGTLDDYVRNLGPEDIASGDAQTLQEVLPRARDVWSRMSRSQTIDDAIENSENYLSGGSSGIRNQFSRILKSDRLSRGFSEAEKRVMRRVVNGSIPEQILNSFSSGIG